MIFYLLGGVWTPVDTMTDEWSLYESFVRSLTYKFININLSIHLSYYPFIHVFISPFHISIHANRCNTEGFATDLPGPDRSKQNQELFHAQWAWIPDEMLLFYTIGTCIHNLYSEFPFFVLIRQDKFVSILVWVEFVMISFAKATCLPPFPKKTMIHYIC